MKKHSFSRTPLKYISIIFISSFILSAVSCKFDYDTSPLSEFSPSGQFIVGTVNGNTNEAGETATLDIKLRFNPDSDVVIDISSDSPDEGTVSPQSLTFTPLNWDTWQTITITGVDDNIYDSTQDYHILFSDVTSLDDAFNGKSINSVSVSNTDNDTKLTALQNSGFSLLKTVDGCPDGFEEGMIQIDAEDDNGGDGSKKDNAGASEIVNPGVKIQMCSTETAGAENVTAMKSTSFIVFRNNTKCPTDYEGGYIKIDTEDEANADYISGEVGDSYLYSDSGTAILYLCKSSDDPDLENLKDAAVTVLKNGDCPGGSVEGSIKLDTEDNNNRDTASGNIGSSYLSNANTKSIYLGFCTFN